MQTSGPKLHRQRIRRKYFGCGWTFLYINGSFMVFTIESHWSESPLATFGLQKITSNTFTSVLHYLICWLTPALILYVYRELVCSQQKNAGFSVVFPHDTSCVINNVVNAVSNYNLSVCLSFLCFCLSVCLRLSVSLTLSVCLFSVSLSVSVCLSVSLSLSPSLPVSPPSFSLSSPPPLSGKELR